MADNDVTIYKPDLSLKQKLSPTGSAKSLFPKEVIESCQTLFDDFKGTFFDSASQEFSRVNTQLSSTKVSMESRDAAIGHIAALKGRAETLGLGLISKLMYSLQEYLERESPDNFIDNIIIKKHLEALSVAINNQISDDGGTLGSELLSSIAKLKQKKIKA